MIASIKFHYLNGWVNTTSGSAPPVTFYRKMIEVRPRLIRMLDVKG